MFIEWKSDLLKLLKKKTSNSINFKTLLHSNQLNDNNVDDIDNAYNDYYDADNVDDAGNFIIDQSDELNKKVKKIKLNCWFEIDEFETTWPFQDYSKSTLFTKSIELPD